MLTILKKMVQCLLYDDVAVRRWVRGFLFWGTTAMTQVLSVGFDTASKWGTKELIFRLAVSGLAGVAGLINLGEKNQRSE